MRRALINVLDNACQAMLWQDETSRPVHDPRLSIGTRLRGERVEIAVTDNGAGIPDEILPRVFEPLYSTKSFGIGLGLPTVKVILEEHGGGVEITNPPGGGAEAVLWLPVQAEELDPLPTSLRDPSARAAS